MAAPIVPKPRLWPRRAVGPLGNSAMFQCMGDIPHGWTLEEPLPQEKRPPTEGEREMQRINDLDKAYLGKEMDDTPLPPDRPAVIGPPKKRGRPPKAGNAER